MDLVFTNTYRFNLPDNQYHKTAKKIQKAAEPILEELNTVVTAENDPVRQDLISTLTPGLIDGMIAFNSDEPDTSILVPAPPRPQAPKLKAKKSKARASQPDPDSTSIEVEIISSPKKTRTPKAAVVSVAPVVSESVVASSSKRPSRKTATEPVPASVMDIDEKQSILHFNSGYILPEGSSRRRSAASVAPAPKVTPAPTPTSISRSSRRGAAVIVEELPATRRRSAPGNTPRQTATPSTSSKPIILQDDSSELSELSDVEEQAAPPAVATASEDLPPDAKGKGKAIDQSMDIDERPRDASPIAKPTSQAERDGINRSPVSNRELVSLSSTYSQEVPRGSRRVPSGTKKTAVADPADPTPTEAIAEQASATVETLPAPARDVKARSVSPSKFAQPRHTRGMQAREAEIWSGEEPASINGVEVTSGSSKDSTASTLPAQPVVDEPTTTAVGKGKRKRESSTADTPQPAAKRSRSTKPTTEEGESTALVMEVEDKDQKDELEAPEVEASTEQAEAATAADADLKAAISKFTPSFAKKEVHRLRSQATVKEVEDGLVIWLNYNGTYFPAEGMQTCSTGI